MLALLVLLLLALGAGALGGLVGTGSSLILLPVLVLLDGPRVAVPVMAIAAVLANVARVAAWWRDPWITRGRVMPARVAAERKRAWLP